MRIGSSSDWHIDAGMDEDIASSVRQMATIFQEGKVDLIALPGDFFDRKSTADGRNLLRELMKKLADIAPVVGCYGNHDQPGDLDIFSHIISKCPIRIYSTPTILKPGHIWGLDCYMHVLPWLTKVAWVASHPDVGKEQGDKTVSQLALQYLKSSVEMNHTQGDKHVLLAHLTVEGSMAENQQPMIGEGITFGRHDLMEAGFSAGIFGHIHLRQMFADVGPFFYNGSPAAMNYGEAPEKFCSILDTVTEEVEWHKLKTIDRFSLDVLWNKGYPLEIAQNDLSRVRGARVRVLLRVTEGEDLPRAKAVVEQMILAAGALEAKVEPQVQPKELVRAIEITKAETLEAKLEAYWVANNNRPAEEDVLGMKGKLSLLEEQCR